MKKLSCKLPEDLLAVTSIQNAADYRQSTNPVNLPKYWREQGVDLNTRSLASRCRFDHSTLKPEIGVIPQSGVR